MAASSHERIERLLCRLSELANESRQIHEELRRLFAEGRKERAILRDAVKRAIDAASLDDPSQNQS